MTNEIKLNTINPVTLPKNTQKDHKVNDKGQPLSHDAETVTNTLGTLVDKMLADNNLASPSQRIIELKDKIANNQYKVDLDQLASKLTHTLLNAK